MGNRGGAVGKVVYYKLEGRWFNLSWCHCNLSLIQNPSDLTTALKLTQPVTEMSTRCISWG